VSNCHGTPALAAGVSAGAAFQRCQRRPGSTPTPIDSANRLRSCSGFCTGWYGVLNAQEEESLSSLLPEG